MPYTINYKQSRTAFQRSELLTCIHGEVILLEIANALCPERLKIEVKLNGFLTRKRGAMASHMAT